MTMFAGTYDAGVSIVGISNLESFLRNTAPYRRALRTSEYGDPERDAEALRKLSPGDLLDRVKAPLLLICRASTIRACRSARRSRCTSSSPSAALRRRSSCSRTRATAPGRRSTAVLQLGHTLKFFDEHLKKKPNG